MKGCIHWNLPLRTTLLWLPGEEALYNLGTYIVDLFYYYHRGFGYKEERGELGQQQDTSGHPQWLTPTNSSHFRPNLLPSQSPLSLALG